MHVEIQNETAVGGGYSDLGAIYGAADLAGNAYLIAITIHYNSKCVYYKIHCISTYIYLGKIHLHRSLRGWHVCTVSFAITMQLLCNRPKGSAVERAPHRRWKLSLKHPPGNLLAIAIAIDALIR